MTRASTGCRLPPDNALKRGHRRRQSPLGAAQHFVCRADEIVYRVVILHRRIILPFRRFDVDITTGFVLFRKKRSRALESLVLEQHLDQTRSRVLPGLVLLVLRQQHPRT